MKATSKQGSTAARTDAPMRSVLPAAASAPDPEVLAAARRFHFLGEDEVLPQLEADMRPALLGRFRDPSVVRTEYPLVLTPADPLGRLTQGFEAFLQDALERLPDARILKDNLVRLHRTVLRALPSHAPVPAAEVISTAGASMQQELRLSKESAERLSGDLADLVEHLPEGAQLLALGTHTPLYLFAHTAHRLQIPRQTDLAERLQALIRDIERKLEVERHKDAEAKPASGTQLGVGAVGARLFDPSTMSKVLGAHRGAVRMATARRARLQDVLRHLQSWLRADEPRAIVLHDGALDDADRSCAEGCRVELVDDPGTAVVGRFDAEAERWAERFRALRIAQLEVDGSWDEERPPPWVEGFGWSAFRDEELLWMPPVAAIIGGEDVANRALLPTSRALSSGRPVKLLVLVQPGHDPRAGVAEGYRLELAYFGISHREAFVHQGTGARPDHLVQGFERGLETARAGLFVISADEDSAGAPYAVGRWLGASAAVESRAHPLFWYAPQAGANWAQRLSCAHNPQPEAAWPTYPLECQSRDGAPQELSLAFTYADYALLDPGLRGHFRRLPADCHPEDLLPLADWLELDPEPASRKLPYIWGDDGEHRLHRLAVSRTMAWLCRDRLGFWMTLRELAGIKNAHVEAAVTDARAQADEEHTAALALRDAEHATALAETERRAARGALERLTAVLLDLDHGPLSAPAGASPLPARATRAASASAPATAAPPLSAMATPAPTAGAPASAARATAAPGTGAPATATPAAPPEVDDDGDDEEEPWVDSALCTSCNDCVVVSAQLFVYDANKQVRIGDPRGGTYAQLVKAAEGCPSRCIHPGTPLDPSEPGLDALRERAKRFR